MGSATGYSVNLSRSVRMVDSEAQTDDDLLQDLLMEKIMEAYQRRQQDQEDNKITNTRAKMELDFSQA